MSEVVCPFKDDCTDYPWRCKSCKHNKGRRSYYEPDYYYVHYVSFPLRRLGKWLQKPPQIMPLMMPDSKTIVEKTIKK